MISRLRGSALFGEFLGFGSSTAADQASRTAINLAAAAHLGSLAWGTWYLLNLVLQYGSLTHLGVLNGLNREFPVEIGRGHRAEAVHLRHAALGFLLLSLAGTILIVMGTLGPPPISVR